MDTSTWTPAPPAPAPIAPAPIAPAPPAPATSPPLPPAAPPAPPGPGASSRQGPRVAALALVAAVLLGGAVGAGYVGGSLADDAAPPTAVPGATTPLVEAGADPAGEPVAAVAQALGPAVVQLETPTGLGSGFVYDADQGLIMTAAHVVDGASRLTVRLADGRTVEGDLVGADDGSDIAVVRIEAERLAAATLAVDDPPVVGQLAVAMGSPFGLDQTVTSGVVSAVGRSVETPGGATPMIQTDAPINPGSSGGALADRTGRVIGVNDSIASGSGGNVGVGFAVPIDTATAVADRLVRGLPVTDGSLGVSAADATDERAGAQVVAVEPASPAADAGIEAGDVVTSLDDDPVASAADLVAGVRSRQPGTDVTVTVDRRGQVVEVAVTLDEAPTG